MARARGARGAWAVSFLLSAALHIVIAQLCGLPGRGVARGSPPAERPASSEVEVRDVQGAWGGGLMHDMVEIDGTPPMLESLLGEGGRRTIARPDEGFAGRGGSRTVAEAATNLADRDDGLSLVRDVANFDRSQTQRSSTGRSRSSHDDRRAVPSPGLQASPVEGRDRKPRAQPLMPSASGRLGRLAARAPEWTDSTALETSSPRERATGSPRERAAGPQGARRDAALHPRDGTRSAPFEHGRLAPMVSASEPSVASVRVGEARDNVDSRQEVSHPEQSFVQASTAGGEPGRGRGGEEGPGPAAAGGVRGGGLRTATTGLGDGSSGYDDELRANAYRRSVFARINALWTDAFPEGAALEGRQGQAIIRFLLWPDGHIDHVEVARPSGVPEFDANVRSAVLRAAPFPPPPASMARPYARWSISFDAQNPAIR